jgi:hypothetical protein
MVVTDTLAYDDTESVEVYSTGPCLVGPLDSVCFCPRLHSSCEKEGWAFILIGGASNIINDNFNIIKLKKRDGSLGQRKSLDAALGLKYSRRHDIQQ